LLLCVAACLANVFSISSARAADDVWWTLAGHVLPAISTATVVGKSGSASTDAQSEPTQLTLTIVLRRSDPTGFQAYLNDVYDSQSPQYRKFLSPQQIADRFGPAQSDYDAVRAYFEGQGFKLAEGSANRMTLMLRGSRPAVEQALRVTISDYKVGDKTFYANGEDPSLPIKIASRVEAVIGLSNLATPVGRPQNLLDNLPDTPWDRALWYALCANYAVNGGASAFTGTPLVFFQILLGEEIVVLSLLNSLVSIAQASDVSSSGTGQTYAKCVNQYNKKYGYTTIGGGDPPPPAWQGADGTGQTIGLLEFDTFVVSDVANYISLMGQPAGPISNVSQVHVNGGATLGANQDEVLLDIDDVLTAAPGANIVVFDAPFTGPGTSFQGMFNAMIDGGVTIISNSWSYCEDQTTLADVQSIDTILQSAAASGISVFTGAGDHGSTCLDGSLNTTHVPATSPHITAVGGTSLVQYPGFTYGKETWWDASSSTPPGGQGGFGVSRFFTRPSYQDGLTSSAMRSIPDVSANADPRFGVKICQASAGGCPTNSLYGGTSSSAPLWAAFAALLNQTQGSNLGFFNPLIYPFANTSAFHNGASMGSNFAHVGLGSPNLARLHQSLTGQPTGPVSPSVSVVKAFAQTTVTLSEGATAPLPSYADGTTQTFIVVTLVDANGIPVGGKNISLTANPGSQAVFTPSFLPSDADTGVAIFFVTDTTIETVTITATDTSDGIVLDGHPQISFMAPPAAGGAISAQPTSVPSDGVSTTTITVTLQDAQGHGSPNKVISLSQGPGHSVISGPVPTLTDINGQVQFTATDGVSEVVVYTAIDVTDSNLAVPGSANVTFTGGSTSCVAAPPTAAPGFAIAPFSTGYFAQNFFFGDVNWEGCPGASNPTFSPSNSVYVADFRTGDLYKFGLAGGAVSDSNKLSNLNPTLGQPTFGKDGKLYATHGATGSGATTGDIVQLDPNTGAQIRVVASNLTCPSGLAVDPLSGDLFFVDECFGGAENPSLWRIHDPAGAATMSIYATLPATPNGVIAFSPDGTIYVVTGYTAPEPQIAIVGGTNTPSPPSVSAVPDLFSFFWVTMGEVQGNGAAKSLLILDTSGVELVDITTNPYTKTLLVAGLTVGSGVIGPDGCLYTAGSDTIYKLTTSAGTCSFVPTNPGPALSLSPAIVSPNPAQGSSQTFTATFTNVSVPVGTPVTFSIEGANSQLKLATTDASGTASISYVGVLAGTDTVTATGSAGGSRLTSNSGTVTWGAGLQKSFLSLALTAAGGIAGAPVALTASLSDASVNPIAPIPSATIQFTLGAQNCSGVTNASGVASCSVTPSAGQLTLAASFAGDATYTPATATQDFNDSVTPATAPGAPTGATATAGNAQATVTFIAPASNGGSAITGYTVVSNPAGGVDSNGGTTGTSHVVTGLTNGTAYTFTVTATNAIGTSAPSAASNSVTPAGVLGDSSNLVYKPLEPCRIMDTRNATVGSGVQGPITGGSLKHIPGFITAGSNWSIYGQPAPLSDCGLTNPPGNTIQAVAIVITILNPNFDAFLGVGDVNDLNTTLSTVALNYTHGQGLSTMYLVPQVASNVIYFALPAGLSANLIFDVVGYFVVSDATALQCTTVTSGPVTIGASSTGSATSAACGAGYALTSGSCDSDSFSMKLVADEASGQAWFCSANNSGGSAAHLTATVNCCGVPGK
jgi:hypothetical protein